MKNRKKYLISSFLLLVLITGCSFNSPTVNPSLSLPYEIVDEEVDSIKDKGLEEYTDKQTLREVTVRDLTSEENKRFKERLENNSLIDLNENYSVVDFSFGDTNRIYTNEKSFLKFEEDSSYFVYDDEIVNEKIYQIPSYKNKKELYLPDEEKIYGYIYDDLDILVLIRNDFLENGLQFKTEINNEVVYIDIN